mgnify:CR=1 FL=1
MCRNWHGYSKGQFSGPGGFKLVKYRTRPLYQSKIKRERKKTKSTLTKLPDSWMLWSIPEKVWAGFPLTDWKESIKKWHKIRGDKAWFRYNRPDRLHFLKNQLSCGFVSIGEGVVNENLNYWLENVSSFLGFWSSFCRHPLLIDLVMWQIAALSLRQNESKNDGFCAVCGVKNGAMLLVVTRQFK